MNIFFLDSNPEQAAKFHTDKHVIKMILESAQMLSTAHVMLDGAQVAYKPTHRNHPSNIWVRSSSLHYEWLYQLFHFLVIEMTHRYGTIHSTFIKYNEVLKNPPLNLKNNGWIYPPQAMPDQYKVSGNPVDAYRGYYVGDKYRFAKWKNREIPRWFDLSLWCNLSPVDYAQRICFMLDKDNLKKTDLYQKFNHTFGFTTDQIYDKISF